MPGLSDTELRVLLVVVRCTLGWYAGEGDKQRRKTHDWISHRQLQQRTGRAGAAVSKAIDVLVRRSLLVVQDGAGHRLATAAQRRARRGRLYYCLGAISGEIRDERGVGYGPITTNMSMKSEVDAEACFGTEPPPELLNVEMKPQVFEGERKRETHPTSTSLIELQKLKTTKENETKENPAKRESTTEIRIDLSNLQSEVISVGFQELEQLKPVPQQLDPLQEPPSEAKVNGEEATNQIGSPSFVNDPERDEIAEQKRLAIRRETAPGTVGGDVEQRDRRAVECSRFVEKFETEYPRQNLAATMPPIEEAELQRLSMYVERYGLPMLERWLPAFFACQFGFVRRRKWSLGAYLESLFVLQAQSALSNSNAKGKGHSKLPYQDGRFPKV